MNIDGDTSADEYVVTAIQIFDYCGADTSGTLRVDVLMDKFAPIVKTNKAEFRTKIAELRSLLDPERNNPEITVSELAMTLNKYSESQKIKVDLEESFNLKGEQAPHDSDSGISTDGFHLLEEMQCELREKSHLAHQLRSQLDFTDRQHEEAIAALTAERDSLRAHLNVLREENISLVDLRRDYEEVCERLCGCERGLEEARRELDGGRRRAKQLHDQVAMLETEKVTLQEQLTKSKDECHRINEMYASRQAALLGENETLRAERADLAARLQDQEEFMQQLLKEKVLLEMELRDVVNKSNQTQQRLDRSIDVSYTEEQMLSQLDSLNADSRFVHEHHLLDEESFVNALRDEHQGRSTNVSLYHELRLSFCNTSRNHQEHTTHERLTDAALSTVATQTENEPNDRCDTVEIGRNKICNRLRPDKSFTAVAIQTDTVDKTAPCVCVATQTETDETGPNVSVDKLQFSDTSASESVGIQTHIDNATVYIQTDVMESDFVNNNNVQSCIDCSKCAECEKLRSYTSKLESDNDRIHRAMSEMEQELIKYEDNLGVLKKCVDYGNDRNKALGDVVERLKLQLITLESACSKQAEEIARFDCEKCSMMVQTESEQSSAATQAELPCADCVSRKARPHRRLRNYLWEPLKWLFQIFAIVCFACAVCALYGVSRRARPACRDPAARAATAAVPWRWLDAQDLMDLLLSIEYVADVPM